ncbi:hypothetical protein Bbelb_096310 [Branchiostoma belcheri]|nr:hypothetical protein Bbelb_096310 [Branchiostoma belcheri]
MLAQTFPGASLHLRQGEPSGVSISPARCSSPFQVHLTFSHCKHLRKQKSPPVTSYSLGSMPVIPIPSCPTARLIEQTGPGATLGTRCTELKPEIFSSRMTSSVNNQSERRSEETQT